ncbi:MULTISPECIES: hypothetical protein [unclassified Phaeobacter]|uniref:hypothetical protein n=1 Tax=unclassified Phaeobacter TaxID=2621772 RepID=UPI003A84A893
MTDDTFEGKDIKSIGHAEAIKPVRIEGDSRTGIVFAVRGEQFALTMSNKGAAQLLLHLLALQQSSADTKNRPEIQQAITAVDVEVHPQDDGSHVLFFDLGDFNVPINLNKELSRKFLEQFQTVAAPENGDARPVDRLDTQHPNALETDRRLHVTLGADGAQIKLAMTPETAAKWHSEIEAYLRREGKPPVH